MGNLHRSDRHTVQGRPAGCHAQGYRGDDDDGSGPQGESAGHHGEPGRNVTNCVRTRPGGTGGGDGSLPHPGESVFAQRVRGGDEHR
jgi:hypothetical protein